MIDNHISVFGLDLGLGEHSVQNLGEVVVAVGFVLMRHSRGGSFSLKVSFGNFFHIFSILFLLDCFVLVVLLVIAGRRLGLGGSFERLLG